MQVCVYPVLAISRIRPGTAVERRNAGLCLPGPGDFKDSFGNRCGAWKCRSVSTRSQRFQGFVRQPMWSVEMQVCVYPVPAISRIRPAAAVELRNAGLPRGPKQSLFAVGLIRQCMFSSPVDVTYAPVDGLFAGG